MAETVVLDIIDGDGGKYSQTNGWEVTRIAKVYGLSGTGHAKIYAAVNASGMPFLGEAHPTIYQARLRDISVKSVSTECVELTLNYTQKSGQSSEPGNPPLIDVRTSVSQIETTKNHEGTRLEKTFTYPANYMVNGVSSPKAGTTPLPKQPGRISKLIPEMTLTFNITETTSPEIFGPYYVGKMNSTTWRGKPAKSWLCVDISGVSNDLGETYQNRYSFQYRPDALGWDETMTFTDPDTGMSPDISQDATVQIYQMANFNNLFA